MPLTFVKYLQILILLALLPSTVLSQEPLSPHDVAKLVPNKVKGYHAEDEFKSKQMEIGTVSYSLCEKNFKSGEKNIKILLFDFNNAPIMYSQAMRKWNNSDPVESDSLILRVVKMDNCSGWESYSKQSGTSQIFLGICDRFFLNLTGEKVELEKLKEVVKEFKLDKFPK